MRTRREPRDRSTGAASAPVALRAISAPLSDKEKSAVSPSISSSITTSVGAGLVKRVDTRRDPARNSLAAIHPVVKDSVPRLSLASSELTEPPPQRHVDHPT